MQDPINKPRKRPGQPTGPRARNRAARTRAIEDATLHLSLQSGIAATTIAEICEQAGIAKGSFYRYFDSKAAVVEALLAPLSDAIQQAGDAALAQMRSASNQQGVKQSYATLATSIGPTVFEHVSVVRLYLSECRAPAHVDRAPVLALRDQVARIALALAEAAHATGALKALDPRVSALVVIGAIETLALALFDNPALPEPMMVISQLMEIVLDGVLSDG